MSFKDYIETREVTEDPIGDIVKSLQGDPWLEDITTLGELKLFIVYHPKVPYRHGRAAAAEEAWNDYLESEFAPKIDD